MNRFIKSSLDSNRFIKVVFLTMLVAVLPSAKAITEESYPMINLVHPDDIECMALNIYHEARNESLAGQVAVAQVVMNRKDHASYPDTVCDVVKQGPTYITGDGTVIPKRHKCQFSWFCDGRADEASNMHAWRESVTIANAVLDGIYPDIVEGSLWYHADYVSPYWRRGVKYVTQIDRHIFYSELSD